MRTLGMRTLGMRASGTTAPGDGTGRLWARRGTTWRDAARRATCRDVARSRPASCLPADERTEFQAEFTG
ncbi:hypothetical protein ABIA38_001496 [Embleya sp. AB8]